MPRAVFSRSELIAELPRLACGDVPPLEVAEFGDEDFESPSSEQEIWAFRGHKQEFGSGLRFWIATLRAQGWEGRESYFTSYAESGLCQPISGPEFAWLVAEYSGSLRKLLPPFIGAAIEFGAGLRMYADWNDVAAVSETADSFVAFYWSTTA